MVGFYLCSRSDEFDDNFPPQCDSSHINNAIIAPNLTYFHTRVVRGNCEIFKCIFPLCLSPCTKLSQNNVCCAHISAWQGGDTVASQSISSITNDHNYCSSTYITHVSLCRSLCFCHYHLKYRLVMLSGCSTHGLWVINYTINATDWLAVSVNRQSITSRLQPKNNAYKHLLEIYMNQYNNKKFA